MAETITRPPLRYHGGKFGKAGVLADWIIGHLPAHECYVEPFGGGGSVLLRKPRTLNEVYNDAYGEVCTFFRVLRDRRTELVDAVRYTPYAEAEQAASFEPPAPGEPEIETARRLLVRSWMTIAPEAVASYRNSGFRSGTKTAARDPGLDWQNLPAALDAVADRLQGVHVYNRDYAYVLAKYDGPATAFYVDPPYVHATRSKAYTGSYAAEMNDDAHRALLVSLNGLSGMVLLSGYDCALYRERLDDRGWQRVERRTFANGRGTEKPERREVLWLNAAAASALPSPTLFDPAPRCREVPRG